MPYTCGVCDHIISAEQLQLLVLYIIAVRVRDAAVVITRFTYRFRHRERAAYRLVADTVNVDVKTCRCRFQADLRDLFSRK